MTRRQGAAFGASIGLHTGLAVWLAWPLGSAAGGETESQVQVVLLPPNEDATFPGLKPRDPHDAEWKPDPVSLEEPFPVADLPRIAAHYQVLFPFVTPGLAIDAFFPTSGSTPHMVFENPYARRPGREGAHGQRLDLTREALQALVDRSWSRANRWTAFDPIRELTDAHDPGDDRLAQLVGLYCEQNALQPYADGAIRDLRLWAQLGLAADHVTFIGFIRKYAAAHPGTKVTTQLLFLLDTIVQANEDALAVLVETDQPDDLQWTRQVHARAYLLARQIQREYARALTRRGLTTRRAVESYHEKVRLEILRGILRTTPDGYRANDARYLIGAILWEQRLRDDALSVWRGLTPGADGSYAAAIAQIRSAVQAPDPDRGNIDHILSNPHGRWLAFSDERLRRFGYRFDTF
jgi:hypothetical protein